jgi:hypothetical protein
LLHYLAELDRSVDKTVEANHAFSDAAIFDKLAAQD